MNGAKVQGNLIKWKEIKKIGHGTQGDVYLVQNVKSSQLFVVKKLKIFSANSGIDKEAIMKLKVNKLLNMICCVERDRIV